MNASALGGALGVSHHTLLRHLDVLESIYLLRRLPPYFRNVGKRLTKAPKVYPRDTGLLHHLLNISAADELASHPSRGRVGRASSPGCLESWTSASDQSCACLGFSVEGAASARCPHTGRQPHGSKRSPSEPMATVSPVAAKVRFTSGEP